MTSAFLDTNILVYMLASAPAKAARARDLVASGTVISVQVLNEFALVARRKHAMDWDELEATLEGFRTLLQVESLTPATHIRAMQIARRYQLRIYDANILAAAEQANCEVVYSEDMQDGMVVGGLRIENPFRNHRDHVSPAQGVR